MQESIVIRLFKAMKIIRKKLINQTNHRAKGPTGLVSGEQFKNISFTTAGNYVSRKWNKPRVLKVDPFCATSLFPSHSLGVQRGIT